MSEKKTETKSPFDGEVISRLADLKRVGRYEIIRQLGQGGTAIVYLGMDRYIKRYVAIKIANPASDRARERFFLEAQSAGRLSHPSIVAIYDAGVYRDFCYITMEYIEGATLKEFCSKANLLPLKRVLEIVFNVCTALDYAHREGVVHRDIKPSNIMLDGLGVLRITDFGIAQMAEQTVETGIFGTPSYMSPEQVKDGVVGIESDMFSLGCVLYELLTGEQAFSGVNNFTIMYKITNKEPRPLLDIRPDLPIILEQITKKALAKDPKERYHTCMEFAYDLRLALGGSTGTQKDDQEKDVVDYVRHVPFFREFTYAQIRELVPATNIVRVPKGEVIVAEGEIDDTFYIILSGQAKVRKDDKDIALIDVGECFGEMAYIAGQARVATVVADTECILMKISATLLDRSSESIQLLFFKNFATTLVHRFSKTSQKPKRPGLRRSVR
jgi:serine/threonine-protein kinase